MDRYICIHGHFYQPPRENPWLEAIELQDSAYPFHDWNERINYECYAPNAAARILGENEKVSRIVNTYSHISFNFGPTLIEWIQKNDPETYTAIIEADRLSMQRFDGHGSAMAQAYNHMILPLSNRRDRITQIRWGIRDFMRRFGRHPEGMWLPETAADYESLEILADEGIRFTVLAPRQAKQYRHEHGDWIAEGGIDPSTAYKVLLPGGKSMDVFFYDGPISQAIAFEKLLHSGITFADRLLGAFAEHRDWPQLVHIATDGETYGHHHRHGEMALAYAVEYIQDLPGVDIINYGAYLAKYPPVFEAEIHDSSSWSCVHGVERWKADCGCDSGMNGDWHQKWRAPLRQSFDWLRDNFIPLYESEAGRYFSDPWKARDAYIDIILDRSNENLMEFIANQAARTLSEDEIIHAVQLLEIQRHAMLMYTSCGWFFDEISGIETVQCLQYAGRAIQLARKVLNIDLEPEFLQRLEQAPGNVPAHSNGRQVYEQLVMPAMVDLEQVCAHYVISSLFESFESRRVYNFEVELKEHSLMERARYRFAVGRARVRSRVTLESHLFTFAVLHMGEHNLNAGIRIFQSDEDYAGILNEAEDLYNAGDIPDLIRFMDRHFGGSGYTLRSLFHDQQRQIVQEMLAGTLAEVEAWAKQVRDKHLPLISYLIDLGHPLPMIFRNLADVFNNTELRALLAEEPPEMERFARVLAESRLWGVNLDLPGLGRALTDRLESMILRLKADPENHRLLNRILEGMAIVIDLELPLDFWKLQNEYYAIHERYFPAMQKRATEDARSWLQDFRQLGDLLDMDIEVPDSASA